MKVKIKLHDTLAVLEQNLAMHILEFSEASKGWTSQVIAELGRMQDAMTRETVKTSFTALQHLFYAKPIDNRANYSRYIGLIKLAAENGARDLEVDEEEYDKIFNDNWEWRLLSKTANASYTTHK
jgi:hypothetical protein